LADLLAELEAAAELLLPSVELTLAALAAVVEGAVEGEEVGVPPIGAVLCPSI
jgi:hypothetical protein